MITHITVCRFSKLAKELDVVLPISYFERANNAFYNSLAVIDADGSVAGRYRKSHIPDGPGCAATLRAICGMPHMLQMSETC